MFSTIILPAISLGLSATSIPGPLQAYLLNITLNYGWRRGLLIILSPLLTDGPIIFLTVFVLQQIPEWAIQVIRVGGGFYYYGLHGAHGNNCNQEQNLLLAIVRRKKKQSRL